MKGLNVNEKSNAGISPLAAWALAFGCAVGWGAFVMPGTTFLPKAGPFGTVLGIFAGGFAMAVIAWNYHAMINRLPGPGGAYAYAKEAFGIDHAFLCAWFLILAYVAIVWANATALAIMAHYTLGDIFRFGFHYRIAGFEVWLGDLLLAATAIAAAAAINLRRRLAGGVQTVLAVGFLLGIFACSVTASVEHEGGLATTAPAFSPNGTNPVAQILRIVALSPWLFVGFESISHASGEFRFPARRAFGVMAAALAASVLAYAMLAVLPALVPIEGTDGRTDYIGHLGEKRLVTTEELESWLAVDSDFTLALVEACGCGCSLAATVTVGVLCVLSWHYLISFGCCAVWACSAPSKTRRRARRSAASLFFGIIPLTACSIARRGSFSITSARVRSVRPPGKPEWR